MRIIIFVCYWGLYFCCRTILVSTESLSSREQLVGLDTWLSSEADVMIAGQTARVKLIIDKAYLVVVHERGSL